MCSLDLGYFTRQREKIYNSYSYESEAKLFAARPTSGLLKFRDPTMEEVESTFLTKLTK